MLLGKTGTIACFLVAPYHRNECKIEQRGQRDSLSSVYHRLYLSGLLDEMLP